MTQGRVDVTDGMWPVQEHFRVFQCSEDECSEEDVAEFLSEPPAGYVSQLAENFSELLNGEEIPSDDDRDYCDEGDDVWECREARSTTTSTETEMAAKGSGIESHVFGHSTNFVPAFWSVGYQPWQSGATPRFCSSGMWTSFR